MNIFFSFILGIVTVLSGYGFYTDTTPREMVDALGSTMTGSAWFVNTSGQIQATVATWGLRIPSLASSGNCLVTDASGVVSTSACGTGGGGGGDSTLFTLDATNNQIYTDSASTTATTSILSNFFVGTSTSAYSTFYKATTTNFITTNGTSTTFSTGALAVTGSGTSTFAGGINIGTNHLVAHGVFSDASDGLHIHAGNGTTVGLFGAGNTANSLFYGGVNIDGATRLATSLNGFGYLTNGAVTATTSGASLTLARTGNSTYSTLQHLQNIFHSAGYVSGGTITDIGSGNVSVAAGTGLIRNADSAVAEISYFDWTASSTLNTPTNSYRYLGVEYNAGSPRIVSHTTYDWNFKTDFPLGNVVNTSGTLHIENSPFAVGDHAANMIKRDIETMPYERDMMTGGLILGETGTRNVTVSTGAVWQGLTRHAIPAIDTSATGSFTTWAYNGSSWNATTSVTQYPNTQYNNIASGLVTMSANRYANLWFYLETDGGFHMVYGQNEYTSLGAAEAAAPPTVVPDKITIHSWLIGRIVFQKSAASASSVQSVYTTVFSASSASNHANLSNLAWTTSGHTGTAITLAGFSSTGVASEYATSTPSVTAPITYSGTFGSLVGGVAGSFGCTSASVSVTGCLTTTDWNIFNNKVSSTSIDTSAEIAALVTDETGTAGSLVFSAGPTFTATPTFQNLFVSTAGTTTLGYASTTALTVANHAYLSTYTATAGTTTSASSTNLFATNASTTNFWGAGLTTCNSASQALTWIAGKYGCNTIAGDGVSDWKMRGTTAIAPTTTVGIVVSASSTIGDGTGAGALTISGNGTTTLSHYVGTDIKIGTSTAFNSAKLTIDMGAGNTSTESLYMLGNINSFLEDNVQNMSTGVSAQGCRTTTANTGSLFANFLSICINNSGYSATTTVAYNVGGPNDTSLMSLSLGDLYIVNATSTKSIFFMTGGVSTSTNIRMKIDGNGLVGISTSTPESKLDVWGTNGGKILTLFSNAGTKFMEMLNTGVTTLLGVWDFGGATSIEIVNGANPTVDATGEIALDTTSNQLVLYGTAKKVIGDGNIYSAFTYATSTAWSGTTTIPLGTAYIAETWNGVQCFTDVGTLNVSFYDGTNRMNPLNASTTANTITLSTNNTFTAGEKRYVDVGTPATSPTKISCTVSKSLTSD